MRAKDNHDGAGLILIPIFLANDIAVMSRRNESAHRIAALPLNPISSNVDPAALRVPVDVQTAGAYIRTAVQFMPEWSREDRQVDIIVDGLIFHHRSIGHIFDRIIRRFRLDHSQFIGDSVGKSHGIQALFDAHG